MTSTELKQNLKTLGWSQAELARRIDVTPTAVSRWCRGRKVPGSVAKYVELAVSVKKLGSEV